MYNVKRTTYNDAQVLMIPGEFASPKSFDWRLVYESMNDFKKLRVWDDAVELSRKVYELVRDDELKMDFGLTNQLTKSTVSVASNIAEGAARNSNKEFLRFLNISSSSAAELWTQLEIVKRNGTIDPEEIERIQDQIDRIRNSIYKLSQRIKSKLN